MLLDAVPPLPSRPLLPSPQHIAAPAVVTAQVWLPPAVMLATPLVSPLTATGVGWLVNAVSLQHVNRGEAVSGGVIPQLTERITTPALYGPHSRHCAGVTTAKRYRGHFAA